MEITFAVIFVSIAIVIIIVDLYFAARSYRERSVAGKYLGRSAVLAALVTGSYLVSILLTNYFAASLMCSLYFIFIDWMLLTLLKCVTILSIRIPPPKDIPLMWVLRFMAVVDNIILLINPFREIAIHYIPIQSFVAHYQYEKDVLYNLHLAFTYLLVLGVVGILIRKIVKTPPRYRNQYIFITASILLIVAVNAVFILPEKTSLYTLLDYSVIGYSVALLLMYWSLFSYSRTFMLEGLSKIVFDNVNQGIILFDYMNFVVMYNRRLKEILPQLEIRRDMTMADFMEQCRIPGEKLEGKKQYSIQSFSQKEDLLLPVRCDYRKLLDEDESVIGQLFVFSDDADETDLLTGFQSWDHFRRFVQNHSDAFAAPYTAVIFDINSLAQINRRLGNDIGDRRVHELAELIRENMPRNSRLVRGYDANLISVCPGLSEEETLEYALKVVEASGGTVQMGLASPKDQYENILKVLMRANRSMTIRKLLDPEATRSQALTSLVRALKESDSDTEAHVQRTERMGHELGRRLHLNDLQMSQLSLLCLLHDIGKIGIPLEILNKPGRLTKEEWAVMRSHAEKGYQIAVSSRELRDIAEMIQAHHERWDGHGYPHRMKEEEIPVLARVISVVDSYDAMVNDRVYRPALSTEAAREEIRRCAGGQFDPVIAREFLQMLEEQPWVASEDSSAADGTLQDDDHGGIVPLPAGVQAPEKAENESASKEGEHAPGRSYAVNYSRYLLDVNDRIIEADDNFAVLTGYTKEDIEERNLKQSDLIEESDRLEYYMNVDSQMARGDIIYIEHDILRKDGSLVHVYCCGRRYFDAASKSVRSDIIIVDATGTHHGKVKMKI